MLKFGSIPTPDRTLIYQTQTLGTQPSVLPQPLSGTHLLNAEPNGMGLIVESHQRFDAYNSIAMEQSTPWSEIGVHDMLVDGPRYHLRIYLTRPPFIS